MKYTIVAAALVAVGCLQMAGDLLGHPGLRAAGAVTHASPAPKVFTAQNGYETFSSRFFLDWQDENGAKHTLEITPHAYRNVQGPYNRRNAYGAALSYGPVLVTADRTRPMFASVVNHAFCGSAPLLTEIGIPSRETVQSLRLRLEPRSEASRDPRWQTEFTIVCSDRHSN